ncbi:hypothetical protein EBY67_07580 [bacterium]|nr:hypothetical protein [bacterium]
MAAAICAQIDLDLGDFHHLTQVNHPIIGIGADTSTVVLAFAVRVWVILTVYGSSWTPRSISLAFASPLRAALGTLTLCDFLIINIKYFNLWYIHGEIIIIPRRCSGIWEDSNIACSNTAAFT